MVFIHQGLLWKDLNPEYDVKLYTDLTCKEFLLTHLNDEYVQIFDFLEDGPIKADFWRLCVLYINGGIYVDADIKPVLPIKAFLLSNIDLAISNTYETVYTVNPNFIATSKENPIIRACLDWYLAKYRDGEPYDYWNWSIVLAFTQTLHIVDYSKTFGIYDSYISNSDQHFQIQLFQQCKGEQGFVDDYVVFNNETIYYDRADNYDHVAHNFR